MALFLGAARQYCVAVLCTLKCTLLLRDGTRASVNVQRNAETFRRAAPHGAAVVVASGAAERIWVDKIGVLLEFGLLFLSNGSYLSTDFEV